MATDQNLQSLNTFKELFLPFKKKLPTIQEALEELGLSKRDVDDLVEFSTEKAKLIKKRHSLSLSEDEIAAIYAYTSAMIDGEKKPYEYINEALSSPNKKEEIPKVKKFLALFLSGLRKLPRNYPSLYTLYRGINVLVPLPKKDSMSIKPGDEMEDDDPNKGYSISRGRASVTPYTTGGEKIWWSFTSTTGTLSTAKSFTKEIVDKEEEKKKKKSKKSSSSQSDNSNNGGLPTSEPKKGTLFVITMAWGYDISIFSEHSKEKEYLLEPESHFTVEGILETPDSPIISMKFNAGTNLVLEDIFPPKYKTAKPLELPVNKEIKTPEDLTMLGSWCNGVSLFWNSVNVKGMNEGDEDIIYQIGAKEAKKIGSSKIIPMNSTRKIPTEENPFMAGVLHPKTRYKMYVRIGTPEFYSDWSKNYVCFVTPDIGYIEDLTATNPYCNKALISWKEVSFCPQYHISYEVQGKPLGDPKAPYETLSTTDKTSYEHEFEDSGDTVFEFRVRAIIKAQTEHGEQYSGEWSRYTVTAGPVKDIKVTDLKCSYSADSETINLSWSPVKAAPGTQISYVVSCNNTFKMTTIYTGKNTSCTYKDFEFGCGYGFFIRVRQDQTVGLYSKKADAVITLPLKGSFPGEFRAKLNNSGIKNYVLSQENSKIAVSKLPDANSIATVVGNTILSESGPSTWSFRVHKITELIYFGFAPLTIRSVTTTKSTFKYGWFVDVINGFTCFGTENARLKTKVKLRLDVKSFRFQGTGGLQPGDVVTLTYDPSPNALSLSVACNGTPMFNGNPVFTGIPPDIVKVPAVMMLGNDSAVELFGK